MLLSVGLVLLGASCGRIVGTGATPTTDARSDVPVTTVTITTAPPGPPGPAHPSVTYPTTSIAPADPSTTISDAELEASIDDDLEPLQP